jgi:poly(hydroxyalkanoate) depolymerase family esterase
LNPYLHSLMADATRLTQGGDLLAATRAIQEALAAHTPPGALDVSLLHGRAPWPEDAAGPMATPAPAGVGFTTGNHHCSAGQRDFKLFVPAARLGDGLLGLVVMLHGCTQDPDDFAAGTAMNDLAQQLGFCVLYPAQSAQVNPQRCWNWFKHTHQQAQRGEPAIIASMTRRVLAEQPIDPARVYVAGLSAGGAMAAILGREHPGLYAAVGVHSGLAAGAAHDLPSALAAMKNGPGALRRSGPAEALPTIIFHGDADGTVSPANGDALMASLGAAETTTTVVQPAGRRRATCQAQRDGQGRTRHEYWRIHGAGHAWSGGAAQGSYTDPQGPDASAEMLRFFSQHRLDAQAPRQGIPPGGPEARADAG